MIPVNILPFFTLFNSEWQKGNEDILIKGLANTKSPDHTADYFVSFSNVKFGM